MRTNYIKKQIQKIKKQRKYNERKKKLTLTWEDVDAETATEVDVEDVAKKLKETRGVICPAKSKKKIREYGYLEEEGGGGGGGGGEEG